MEAMPEINLDTAKKSAKQAVSALKSAGSLVAKKAEETKIVTATLPRAYGELGKVIYKNSSRRREFQDLFRVVDGLLADRMRIKEEAESRPTAGTLADKAKHMASDATAIVKTKAIDLQAFQVFVKLGEESFQRLGEDAGPAEVIKPIVSAVARRDQLLAEMSSLQQKSKGEWLTPKRIAWTVGIALGLAVLGNLVGDNGKEKGSGGASGKTGDGSSTSTVKNASGVAGSRQFKSIVANMRRKGFLVEEATLDGNSGSYVRLKHAVLCYKSNGEDDVVICVAEFEPQQRDEISAGEAAEHIICRSKVSMCASIMYGLIASAGGEIKEKLFWVDKEKGVNKNTTNGTTEFGGVILIGGETATVSWLQDLRWLPNMKIWRVESGQNLLMMGPDDDDTRPSTTRLIQKLLTGGR
jgi:hypothetical protein